MNRPWTLMIWMAALAAAAPCVSHAERIEKVDQSIGPGSTITFKMLVGSVFNDPRDDPDSGGLITAGEKVLRRPGSKERTVLPEGTLLNRFEAIRVLGDGRLYVVMFWSAETDSTDVPGGGAAILAVFPEDRAEPLDVAEVKADVLCSLGEGPLLPLGPAEAFTIHNHHVNAGQGYLITTLFHIHQGRLQRVGEVLTMKGLGPCETSFKEELSWRTEPDGRNTYRKVVGTVELIMGLGEDEGGECPRKKQAYRRKKFLQAYRWSSGHGVYLSEGRGFDALKRFNEKQF